MYGFIYIVVWRLCEVVIIIYIILFILYIIYIYILHYSVQFSKYISEIKINTYTLFKNVMRMISKLWENLLFNKIFFRSKAPLWTCLSISHSLTVMGNFFFCIFVCMIVNIFGCLHPYLSSSPLIWTVCPCLYKQARKKNWRIKISEMLIFLLI